MLWRNSHASAAVLQCFALAQTKNALERLAATFVEGHAVDQSFGGEATTQDLVRLVLCAHIACDRDIKRSNNIVSEADAQALMPSFLTAISAVLPDVLEVLRAEPDPTALERAGEPSYLRLLNIACAMRQGQLGEAPSHTLQCHNIILQAPSKLSQLAPQGA